MYYLLLAYSRADALSLQEAYGNESSDSSDEDFYDSEGLSTVKKTEGTKDSKSSKKHKQSESTTPVTKTTKKLDSEGTSDKSGNKSAKRRIGEAATKV